MALTRDLLAGTPHPSGWGVAVTATHPTSHAYSITMLGEEISRCLLCAHAGAHEDFWRIAETLAPAQVVLHRPRGVPWLAVTIGLAILDLPRQQQLALSWLEAAVAWQLLSETDR
jgi:hypothetical protein